MLRPSLAWNCPYIVNVAVAGSKVQLFDEEGNELARNISFIKKVLKPENEYKQPEIPINKNTQTKINRVLYPKRNR